MAETLWNTVKENAKSVAMSTVHVVADNVLAVVWVAGEYGFEHYAVPAFPVQSPITTATLWGLRVIFASSTLIPTASRVWKNIRIRWKRDIAEVKSVEKEIKEESGDMEQLTPQPIPIKSTVRENK